MVFEDVKGAGRDVWSEAAELLQQEPGSMGPGAGEGLASP